jgi:hypothetical protein
MVLGQALEARCICEALRHEQADGVAELVHLSGGPTVDVLKECWERCFLKGLLKILVPPNKLVENLDVRLYVLDLCRLLDVEDGERREGSAVLDIAAAWLEETANEDNLEEVGCILEKLESAACLN